MSRRLTGSGGSAPARPNPLESAGGSAPRALTRPMRVTLIVTAAVMIVGMGAGVWLSATPVDPSGATATATTAAAVPSSGPAPDATPNEGSEILPPSSQTETVWDRLPDFAEAAPRVSAPLPVSGSAQGSLVEGYPTDLAAPFAESDVLDTSVATEGDVMQFTLVARSDAPGDEIVAHYGAEWSGLGLVALAGDAAGTTASYRDDYSSVSISADTSSGTGTVYTIFGVLRAG